LARPVSGGRLIGLLGATFFGITAPLTRLALDGGSNPITVVGFRFLICVLAMSAAIKLLGQGYTLPPRTRWRTLGISLVWPLGPLGYVSSIFFMPVSLAVLILYTYPLMVAAASPFMEGGKFGRARICAFLLAFTGLAIALGPTAHDLDWRGMVFALIAAIAVATTLMLGRPLVVKQGVFKFSLYMNTGSTLLITIIILATGGVALPQTTTGWIGLAGTTFFFTGGMLLMFTAIRTVGSAVVALLMNLEPMIAILAAAFILGERLTPVQLAGAMMVVGALCLSTRLGSAHS
jgi:drug/metabolite transporter (DMT)-like permease